MLLNHKFLNEDTASFPRICFGPLLDRYIFKNNPEIRGKITFNEH